MVVFLWLAKLPRGAAIILILNIGLTKKLKLKLKLITWASLYLVNTLQLILSDNRRKTNYNTVALISSWGRSGSRTRSQRAVYEEKNGQRRVNENLSSVCLRALPRKCRERMWYRCWSMESNRPNQYFFFPVRGCMGFRLVVLEPNQIPRRAARPFWFIRHFEVS